MIHLIKLVVTKRVLFSVGFEIQDACQSWPQSIILKDIEQPCNHNIPLSAADILKMTLGVMYDQRFIINIGICHNDPHKSFDSTSCFKIVDYLTIQYQFYG